MYILTASDVHTTIVSAKKAQETKNNKQTTTTTTTKQNTREAKAMLDDWKVLTRSLYLETLESKG